MSQQLISHSADLKALHDDGYEVAIKSGHLVLFNVPYVNSEGVVKRGTLVSTLDMAGDKTVRPSTHVVMFAGEYPCDKNGRPLEKIRHASNKKTIDVDLVVKHSFSSKPNGSYPDYFEKMSTYAGIVSGPAEAIDPTVTARTHAIIETNDPDEVFNYVDTASGRAGICGITRKLALPKIAIIGLGGTGSYVFDLVAKTPALEIHLFDGDYYFQHNAFRGPGAPSIEQLRQRPQKVHYFAELYGAMRKNIVPHAVYLDSANLHLLEGITFVFICIDSGVAKLPIIEKLQAEGIPFIDVGMGIELVEDKLLGILRVTASTQEKSEHIKDRISLTDRQVDAAYSSNIQIADLNALNASLAVVKWKKIFGFYVDLENEHSCNYTLDGNIINNSDLS